MKTVERHKKTDFGDVWYVNAIDGTYRFAIYKYDDDPNTIYLSNVFVKEESRRHGYGNEILKAAEDYAKKFDVTAICLKVLSGSDVHRWYKRHGYEDLEKDEEERGYMWMRKMMKEVNESIWSDMQDRGSGELVKKEDDVNPLKFDDFFEYLTRRYTDKKSKNGKDFIVKVDDSKFISLITFEDTKESRFYRVGIWDFDNKPYITIPKRFPFTESKFFEKISEAFELTTLDVDDRWQDPKFIVRPKNGGNVDNRFFITVIDFLIDNVEPPYIASISRYDDLKESVWSDMQDRGNGDLKKKEDEIPEEFKKVLAVYIYTFAHLEAAAGNYTVGSCSEFISFIKDYQNKPAIIQLDPDIPGLVQYVKDHWDFICDTIITAIGDAENEVDKIIDDLRKNSMNESIWSDMQSRGTGDLIKKEDDVSNMDMNQFIEYLVAKYWKTNKIEYIDKDHYCQDYETDIVIDPVKDVVIYGSYNNGELKRIMVVLKNDKRNDDLILNSPDHLVWNIMKTNRYEITEKRNEITNKTYVDLLDFILKYYNVNESIWSDMQDRGNGDIVKKEEEMTEPELEFLDKSLWVYAGLYVWEEWEEDGEELTYEIFYEIVKTSDQMTVEIGDDYKEEYDLDKILKYADKNWDTLLEKLKGYVEEEKKWKAKNLGRYARIAAQKSLVKESVWSDMQARGVKDVEKKEDKMSQQDLECLDQYIMNFANEVVYGQGRGEEAGNLDEFCDYIRTDNEVKDVDKDRILKYVKEVWFDELCDEVSGSIEQAQKEYHQDMYESVWTDMQDRGTGNKLKKEDDKLDGRENTILRQTSKMFKNAVKTSKYDDDGYQYSDTKEDFIFYIQQRKGEMFWTGVKEDTYDKLLDYVERKWDDNCKGIDDFSSVYIYECEGVPGGLTPADVGGMGAAYFPGPNGEPGSGDLPMPTGKVYQQVAPFGIFIKERKKKGKKKKKFRKEDEPCVHSPNAKVYDYVDDYREYVDRTYDMVNKRK